MVLGFLPSHLERIVERSVRRLDSQPCIEDHEGFAHRLHDALGVVPRLPQCVLRPQALGGISRHHDEAAQISGIVIEGPDHAAGSEASAVFAQVPASVIRLA